MRGILAGVLVCLGAAIVVCGTTTTTQPSSSGPLLRFPAVYLAQQQHLAPLVDPRNGAPSDEYSRYVMASQQIWQVLPVCRTCTTRSRTAIRRRT